MKLIAISAMGKHRQIGLNGDLPWRIPEEYKHYEDTVRGHFLIVGRKNYESHKEDIRIGRPLVVSQNPDFHPDCGAPVFHDVESVLEYLKKNKVSRAFVIGGEGIYSLFLPVVDEMLLSYVDYDGEGDTFFPDFDPADWKIVKKEDRGSYLFCHYKRS